MCCSALPALGRAPRPARELLLSKRGGGCAFLCSSQGERGAWGSREVDGAGGSSADGAALRVFLASGKVTSEEKGHGVLFN